MECLKCGGPLFRYEVTRDVYESEVAPDGTCTDGELTQCEDIDNYVECGSCKTRYDFTMDDDFVIVHLADRDKVDDDTKEIIGSLLENVFYDMGLTLDELYPEFEGKQDVIYYFEAKRAKIKQVIQHIIEED